VAFTLFDESPADIALVETGMGGRDDSTNVVSWPTASIITPIGLDHQDVLGASLAEIASHKAGILKRNSPAVIARQADEAREVIEAYAERIGAPLFRQGAEWDAHENNGRLVVQTENRALDLPLPSLPGRHQIDNAGLACAAFLAPGPFTITDEAFAAGVLNGRVPARLQSLTRGPLSAAIRAASGEVWVDVGHNAHAAEALAIWLNDMKRKRAAPAIAIVGVRSRKDAEAFLGALALSAERLVAVPLPEAHVAPALLAQITRDKGVDASEAPSLQAAMQNAAQFPAPRVLICGSFLLAAEALRLESA
jgi:dihydrofolate synthase/folylpolyglutamate synthase